MTDRSPAGIAKAKAAIIAKYGEWTAASIYLGSGIWTSPGPDPLQHWRVQHFLRIAADFTGKDLRDVRVLDLGCLEGLLAIGLAAAGAEVVGVDIREGHIAKARFAAEMMGLSRVSFQVQDALTVTAATHGQFDVVICAGLFYHFDADQLLPFLLNMLGMSSILVLDTHFAPWPMESYQAGSLLLKGHSFPEHGAADTVETKLTRAWSSYENVFSFWPTRASLIELLTHVGYASVYEPIHPRNIFPHADRATFVALKAPPVTSRSVVLAEGAQATPLAPRDPNAPVQLGIAATTPFPNPKTTPLALSAPDDGAGAANPVECGGLSREVLLLERGMLLKDAHDTRTQLERLRNHPYVKFGLMLRRGLRRLLGK